MIKKASKNKLSSGKISKLMAKTNFYPVWGTIYIPEINIIKGDITKQKVDAIVNSANEYLLVGGGVDGAIHLAAGDKLEEECKSIGRCEISEAVITKGYNLDAKHVIHTVSPRYKNEEKIENVLHLLRNCYKNTLLLALKNNIESIAFPAIGTGIFQIPYNKACKVALSSIKEIVCDPSEFHFFKKINFIVRTDENYETYVNTLKEFFNQDDKDLIPGFHTFIPEKHQI